VLPSSPSLALWLSFPWAGTSAVVVVAVALATLVI